MYPKQWDVLPLRDFVETGPGMGYTARRVTMVKEFPIVRIGTFNNGMYCALADAAEGVSGSRGVVAICADQPGDMSSSIA